MKHRQPQTKPEFLELHDRIGRRLLAYLTRRMHDADAAAELWAECWAIAFENWSRCRFEGEGGAEGWVFGIARNQLAAYYRSGSIERRALTRLRWTVPVVDQALEEELNRLIDREGVCAILADALDQLPAKRRLAVRLRIIDGLEYREVAKQLDCTEQAARAQVSRGLQRLAQSLDRNEFMNAEVAR
jgi:RNA polymerase sigma-70 factor, ECF subfamily